MNISLHHLRILQAIAKQKSITKASVSLNMSQPAVSIQLKNLQDQFEIPLTEIIGKQIHITSFGEELVETANRIFAELEMIQNRVLEMKGLLTGKIKISTVSTGKYLMPYIMSDFLKIHTHLEMNLEVSNRITVISHLQENSTDLALVSMVPEELDLDSIILTENKWYLACAPENADLYRAEIEKGNWDKIPFVLREKGSGTRVMMEKFFMEKEFTVNSKMDLSTNEAVKQAVMAGLGASLLSNFSMTQEIIDKRITILEYPGLPLTANWTLVWLKQKNHNPAVKAFLNWIGENKESVFKTHFSHIINN